MDVIGTMISKCGDRSWVTNSPSVFFGYQGFSNSFSIIKNQVLGSNSPIYSPLMVVSDFHDDLAGSTALIELVFFGHLMSYVLVM